MPNNSSPRPLLLRLMLGIIRRLGRWGGYIAAQPTAIYLLHEREQSRQALAEYVRRVHGPRGFLQEWFAMLRICYHFATALIDRAVLALQGPSAFRIVSSGDQRILEEVRKGRGVILLGSHIGNWEVAASVLPSLGVPLTVLMSREEEDSLSRTLREMAPESGLDLLTMEAGDGFEAGLAALGRLRAGGILALKGDRPTGKNDVVVPLLGAPAYLPSGPVVLAALAGCPVFQVHCFREGLGRYRMMVEAPYWPTLRRGKHRAEDLKRWVGQYSRSLQTQIERYPQQWFNFRSPWASPQAGIKGGEEMG